VSGFGADYPDPDGFFRGLFREPFPFYRDDEIEEMIIEARSLGNQPERMKLYHAIDRRSVAAHRPWIDRFWANPLSKASLDRVVVERRSGVAPAPEEPEAVQSQ
jgi:hypothetical protein